MFEKINKAAVIKSSYLGMLIGFMVQVFGVGFENFWFLIVSVVLSGVIGLVIGFVTEWITSLLPISLANPKTFFAINSTIALLVASIIFIVGKPFFYRELGTSEFTCMIAFILVAIAIANLVDYLNYRRMNRKLSSFQNRVSDR